MGFGKIEGLSKNVICKGLKPRFIIEPWVLDFKKKIIRSLDKAIATFMEVTLNNPETASVFWKIDSSKLDP